MRRFKATTLFFFVAILAVQLFAQDNERWSKPFTKLQPNTDAVVKENFQPLNYKVSNVPIRQVFPDKTYTIYPNVIPVPNPSGTQSEVHIAINPTNTNILLAGANAANTAVTYLNQGWYVTTNGGTSWYGNDSLPPPPGSNYRSDPVVCFDLLGNMYFNTLDYGSSTGDVVTMKSTNNGLTWTKYTIPNPGLDEDKNWIACDNIASSPYVNYLYTAYTEFMSGDPNYYKLEFSRSTDLGLTWSAPIRGSAADGYLHQGINLTTGPAGQVYGAYTNYPTSTLTSSYIDFLKSTNGGTSFTFVHATPTINDIRGNLTKGGNSIRVNSFPYIACDRSNGPRSGWIYITYAARPATGQSPDVYMVRSTDQGATWSAPKRVNADSALTNRDQWFPAAAVDPADGSLNIVYYDSRNFSANDSAEVYMSRSMDGGNTFEDIKISTMPHKPKSISGLATGYQGDYIGIDARNGTVWPVWNDNRTGAHQLYTAKVFFIQIYHSNLKNTENLTGPYLVGARITGSNTITSAKVFWRRGTTGAFTESPMTQVPSTDSFYYNIPGNGSPATYQYYIYAQDQAGAFATLPGGAPGEVFAFDVATDINLPVITHTAIGNQFREEWPVTVDAVVTDNIGVDSVRVNYKINTSGTPRQFYLTKGTGDNFSGVFNVDTTILKVGDTVYYRITARDKAATPNYGYHPSSTGFHAFKMVADTTKPVITHNPISNKPKRRWPAQVDALVTDNIIVDSVWVEWYKNTAGNAKRFNLAKATGDNWTGLFNSDTNQVAVGDSIFYRIVARDRTTSKNIVYLPLTGYYKFNIIETKGIVAILNDDVTLEQRYNPEKPNGFNRLDAAPLGASSDIIKAVLDSVGYLTELAPFATVDTSTFANYDILVLSAGTKGTGIFSVQGVRDAVRNFASLPNKKVLVEGGDVGYAFRSTSTTTDHKFRTEILHTSIWVSDVSTNGVLNVKNATHPINTTPNVIPSGLTLSGTGDLRDAMRVDTTGLPKYNYPTNTWGAYPDSGGIIIYDKNPNPVAADHIYWTFAIGNIDDKAAARKIVENTFEYLMAYEAPPTGKITGTVTVTGAANNGGVLVKLTGVTNKQTTTALDGSYSFDSLYAGKHTVTAYAPANYFPATSKIDTTVGTGTINNINFTFVPIVNGTVQGTVTVTGAPDNSGVLVEVLGQTGKTATTNAAGTYTISGVIPGPIMVRFSKAGFGPKVKDTTLANGGSTTINMTLVQTLGVVLIINDDLTLTERVSTEKPGEADVTTPLGASANLFKSTLDSLGYTTTLVNFADLDISTLSNYQAIIMSVGAKTSSIFNDVAKRDAIRAYANGQYGKTLVEGGEVGYAFRSTSTTADSLFRKQILFVSRWISDASSGILNVKQGAHPINTTPNIIPSGIALTGTGVAVRDAMNVDWAPSTYIYPTNTWSSHPDSGGVIIHDKNSNPAAGDNIFFTFNLSLVTDQNIAKKLIENAVKYLLNSEAPATGGVAGTVTLTGAANNSGAKVYLSLSNTPTNFTDSLVTGNAGTYAFNALYPGRYRVTVIPPAGYFPTSNFTDTTVTTTVINNINFTFTPVVGATVQGTVTVQGAPDNGGVLVTVVGQAGKTATTNAAGTYTISGVTPGAITVTFVKANYKNVAKDTTIGNGQTLTLNATMIAGTNEFIFDFETNNGNFIANNDWTWGTPTKTGSPSPTTKVWATKLDINYTNGIKSELKSPVLQLAGYTHVTLSFEHWYNIEAKTVDTTSYDGGNVKISTDNGTTWTLVTPAGGYPSRIDYTGNPMNGEKCYAGIKEYWSLAEFNLDAYANKSVIIKLDFGTDASVNRTGWFIDNMKIEDKLLLVAPSKLTAVSGQDKRVTLNWQSPVELNKPSKVQDPLMTLNAPEVDVKIAEEMRNHISVQPKIELTQEAPEGFLGFRVYRKSIFDATYGTHLAQVGTTIVTFTDTTAKNDSMYNYIVKAVYDEGLSNPTNEVNAAAYKIPDTVFITKSTTTPVIDGVMNPSEWAEAKIVNLTLNGIGGKMYAKLDTVTRKAYFGVINYLDKTLDNYDQIGLYFDEDASKTWGSDSLAEGNYWIARIGDTTAVIFRGIYGPTPSYTSQHWSPPGVIAKIGKTGAFVSYEVEVNLITSYFNQLPGEWSDIYAYCANGNGSTSTNTGLWPEAAVFSNPATFGNVKWPGSIGPVTATFSSVVGWNLLSVPVKMANMSKGSLFNTAISNAFTFNDAQGYVKQDTLRLGNGYWLKFPAAKSHSFTAVPNYTLKVPVVPGWNLIGALHGQYPVASIVSEPGGIIGSSFYEYTGGSYVTATNIDKGKGFWVKSTGTGTLRIGSLTLFTKGNIDYVENVDNNWPVLVITDAAGNTGKLYLSSKVSLDSKYELPPLPPTGVSDIRFATDKYVDDISSPSHLVNLNSLTYPIKVRIENCDMNFRVKDMVDGSIVDKRLFKGNDVEISNPSVNVIKIITDLLPTQFELSQNYPNPFNPATRIKFALPENSIVKLEVYNLLGEKVATLIEGQLEAGYHEVNFDASKYATGLYLYKIEAGAYSSVKKMMLLK